MNIASEWVVDAAVREMAMLSKMAHADDPAALAEMKLFLARLDEVVKNPPDVKDMQEARIVPAIVRDGYTIRTDKVSGFQVYEMHTPAPKPVEEEPTPLTVFENLTPENMQDVVVLIRDNRGQTAVTSNMTEPGDILLFMEILKTKLLNAMADGAMPDTPSLDGA